jgi:hypothetical protein
MVSVARGAEGAFVPLLDFSAELLGEGNSGGSAAVPAGEETDELAAVATGFELELMG